MPLGSMPSCQDFQRSFDLFFDGEIDGHTMRDFALHVARCPGCEADLRRAETLQEVVGDAVRTVVERIDVAELWRSIESGVEAPHPTFVARLWERWQLRSGLEIPFLTLAAAAALVLIVAGALLSGPAAQNPLQIANNKAQIEALASSAPAVAVWTEPEEQTTAIWVTSFEP